MAYHSILGGSSSGRWLTCSMSALLEHNAPNETNDAADEGTLIHAIGAALLEEFFGIRSKQETEDIIAEHKQHRLYTPDCLTVAVAYSEYAIELFADAENASKNAKYFIETWVDLGDYVPEPDAGGTADFATVAKKTLRVLDLKCGRRHVDVRRNPQLMYYALGMYRKLRDEFEIEEIKITIFQPRLDNVATDTIPIGELLDWGDNVLRPQATRAYAGEGDFVVSKYCKYCAVEATCRKLAEHNLELERFKEMSPHLLTPPEVADILDRLPALADWGVAFKDYALREALRGVKWPYHKVVEGKSQRRYLNEGAIAEILKGELAFSDKEIYNFKLVGLGEMQRLLGKKLMDAALSGLIVKPIGAPTLVGVSDPRPEFSASSAARDFEGIEISDNE